MGWRRRAVLVAAGLAACVAVVGYVAMVGRGDGGVERVVARAGDAVVLSWTDWWSGGVGPEVSGVTGEVVWSDAAQRGYMRLVGLPRNDASRERYQVWIVDAERGMGQRISGGVFDVVGEGEVRVEIGAGLAVSRAGAFAVTIEGPRGTWVSDMSRRVVIATR